MLRYEKPGDISDDLYALACGPDLRVRLFSACTVNGIRYNTVDKEKYWKTQNSGIMTMGTHNGKSTEFYGSLKEIIELQYNSDLHTHRTVVLFRCDWFDQDGKTKGIKDDRYFKSINIERCWYKSDPFILASQSTKIFYLQDTKLGKNWRVVQKFEHRQLYNVAEKDTNMATVDAYQEENFLGTEIPLQDINPLLTTLHREGEKGCHVDVAVVNSLLNQKGDILYEIDSESEDDDTLLQYSSDNDHVQIPTADSDDD